MCIISTYLESYIRVLEMGFAMHLHMFVLVDELKT